MRERGRARAWKRGERRFGGGARHGQVNLAQLSFEVQHRVYDRQTTALHVHPSRPSLRQHTLRLEHLRALVEEAGQCTLPAPRPTLPSAPHTLTRGSRGTEAESAPWARPSCRRRARTLLRPSLAPRRIARGWPARARSLRGHRGERKVKRRERDVKRSAREGGERERGRRAGAPADEGENSRWMMSTCAGWIACLPVRRPTRQHQPRLSIRVDSRIESGRRRNVRDAPVNPSSLPSLHSSASTLSLSSPLYLTHTRSTASRPNACALATTAERAKRSSRRVGVRVMRDEAQ